MRSRRELGLLATGGAIAAALVTSAKPALAQPERQDNMVHARQALVAALESLRVAADDKGGHRRKAMDLVQGAIAEVDAGIHFANTH
jgi:predicted secreted protein